MGKHFLKLLVLPLLVIYLFRATFQAQAADLDQAMIKPSENAGKRESYRVKTPYGDYWYSVYVPSTYSDSNPAGLHIFFHGQGKPSPDVNPGSWKESFLEPFNLIGIRMQYMDGDNSHDTEGKVMAARFAIAQTQADYKIIAGRGAIGSFSGGGLVHSAFFKRYAKIRGSEWPFCHMGLYGSNYWDKATQHLMMSWFIGLGENEWNAGGPTLGVSQCARAADLFALAAKGNSPDVYLKITAGKGHSISPEDNTSSAQMFRRCELAYAPFIYSPDYPEPDLKKIVDQANDFKIGKAAKYLEKMLAKPELDAALRAKLEKLKVIIDKRIEQIFAVTRDLSESDPLLLDYYGDLYLKSIKEHSREKELKDLLKDAPVMKQKKKALNAYEEFVGMFRSIFRGGAQLAPGMAPKLRDIAREAGDKSLLAAMCCEFLTLDK